MAFSAPPAMRARLNPTIPVPSSAIAADALAVMRRSGSTVVVDDEFDRLTEISRGSHGVLYKARRIKNGEIVALKRLVHHRWLVQPRNPDRPGVLRLKRVFDDRWRTEVDCLAACRHPNVVRLGLEDNVAADSTGCKVFLVMDYAYTDLGKILETLSRPFTEGEVKFLMLQLLNGVKCIHDHGLLHGDLKPGHILVDHVGDLKICDFSQSRRRGTKIDDPDGMMKSLETLCYMPPELLLGVHKHKEAVSSASTDMWSLGCIMAQLLNNQVLFPGTFKDDHIKKMFLVLGTPDAKEWPALSTAPDAAEVINRSGRQWSSIRSLFPATPFPGRPTLSRDGYHLLRDLLCYDPKRRLTVEAALQHPWFRPSGDGSSGPPAVKPRGVVSPAVDFADAVQGPYSSSSSTCRRNNK